ncbi:ribose-phosphate diphosphokinase [Helcococcus kunzii]|uniref:Ribose-phosphate pyrophosphokinase n=1 Tax=Helcococcus kunzii ATCC 51366 TaxID=883114 RepID=H3NML0_9FIRM|nr:ribose-phosphate pyrophosphokinase [Helcococcus kunzii]EHR34829.1 ribose-phosphate diphosphokinase [Helcococcus kunzii ATCC 51366]MCT1796739.1 ribose-phosphate pyrophosphokinase [Helcococcus kunzii]MCT1988873.1 ribose-phosphate pyrophosphokinase [Helcococcus kunzii]QUY64518.1 ribose-phosphate pyrophosphokinase [Helcococcus kunzii]QZO76931.1 ribose-phosphate pyrophosphokinase [Helcococcus kunzii]
MRSAENEVKIFSGTSNRKLAEDIAKELEMELGDISISQFADGEISVKIEETVRGRDVFLIQPTSKPVNENLMEALIIIDALKRASAHKINLVMPYYGYARQDRKSRGREPITAKLVTDLIERAGADRVVSVDLHAGQIQGFFDIPLDHLTARPIIAEYFEEIIGEEGKDEWTVVSPDLGGVTRARALADVLGLQIAIIEKSRPRPNESEILNVIGEFKDQKCIIIDDIIDTAGTIVNAAETLIQEGAKEVYISASHGVLSGPAIDRITNSKAVAKCIVTDTIYQPKILDNDKFEILSMAPMLAETIRRITSYTSVSEIMKDKK